MRTTKIPIMIKYLTHRKISNYFGVLSLSVHMYNSLSYKSIARFKAIFTLDKSSLPIACGACASDFAFSRAAKYSEIKHDLSSSSRLSTSLFAKYRSFIVCRVGFLCGWLLVAFLHLGSVGRLDSVAALD